MIFYKYIRSIVMDTVCLLIAIVALKSSHYKI